MIRHLDLHSHSTASDGVHRPGEVVRRAKAAGIRLLALTDHDTTAGIAEAREAAEAKGLHLVDGVEISADAGIELHILGFFVNPADAPLQNMLLAMREERWERADKTMALLRAQGLPVTTDMLSEILSP